MAELTHFDQQGNAHMVDVSGKQTTAREAVAAAEVLMRADTLAMIADGQHKKGDVLGVARIAGIQAAKKCSELIPLCHPLALTAVQIDFTLHSDAQHCAVRIRSTCRIDAKTGVEMEALTAASVAALTIYDMCKAVDKGMQINGLCLIKKTGGKSGDWGRSEHV